MNDALNPIHDEYRLISKAKEGHQPSFKLLYDLYVDMLFRFLNQFSEDREQTREWTQRAFIKAFDRLDQFRERSSFKTWLFTIGLNEMRTDMRRKVHFLELDESHIEDETGEDITEQANWKKAKDALQQLTPDKRIICLLHIAEGYSHEEIGNMLGISEVTSRVTLHRAKNELRKQVNHEE